MTRFIFCYEEQILINEGNKEKVCENYCVKNINSRYYFGEKASELHRVWPNLIRMHFNKAIRQASTLEERSQLVRNFLNQNIDGTDRHVFIMPRDIIEIIEKEQKEIIDEFSDRVLLQGFGMFYSKITKNVKKESITYTIHVYQGLEGIEGVLSEMKPGGELKVISEIYVKPSNQSIILNKVIEHLYKQVQQSSSVKLYIKTGNELTKKFPYLPILEQKDEDFNFTFNSSDFNDDTGSYEMNELQYDLKLLANHLIERLPNEKYKSLFSSIIYSFNKVAIKDQEFVLEQLKNVILKNSRITDDDLEKLRNIFLLRKSSTYKVGFISPFSYGKSSLINGLLGKSLLKADIRAETAVVTHVTYADEYSLFFVNNEEIIADRFDTIDQFKEEVDKITSVHTADETLQHLYLTLPYDTRYPSIEWIDTPGLFAKHEYHNQVTDEAIEGLDLVVYVFDPTKIGEKPFTKKIKEYTEIIGEENTIFAIGKRDSVVDSLELIEQELRQHLPKSQEKRDIVSASGYFALRARQYKSGQLELVDLQKDYLIYAHYKEDSYSGKRLEAHHIDRVLEMSNIGTLERVIYKKVRKWLKEEGVYENSIVLR
ncbi:dynamin family protein [Gracilibacillus lacisalsi]|uniref:dynamin family protein n=1 Tax=Gracilibacillus lacisalsi TaxID=393087 RepID=UPI000376D6CB|nr:dynamin family protein [Gracilibacillus lacisalsi]